MSKEKAIMEILEFIHQHSEGSCPLCNAKDYPVSGDKKGYENVSFEDAEEWQLDHYDSCPVIYLETALAALKVQPCKTCGGSGRPLIPMPIKYLGKFFNACTEPCDFIEGPCACGASHHWEDWPEEVKSSVNPSCPDCPPTELTSGKLTKDMGTLIRELLEETKLLGLVFETLRSETPPAVTQAIKETFDNINQVIALLQQPTVQAQAGEFTKDFRATLCEFVDVGDDVKGFVVNKGFEACDRLDQQAKTITALTQARTEQGKRIAELEAENKGLKITVRLYREDDLTAEEENTKNTKPCPYDKSVPCVQYPEDSCGCDPCEGCEIKPKDDNAAILRRAEAAEEDWQKAEAALAAKDEELKALKAKIDKMHKRVCNEERDKLRQHKIEYKD